MAMSECVVLFIWLDTALLHCTLQQHTLSPFVFFQSRTPPAWINIVVLDFVAAVVVLVMQTYSSGLIVTTNRRLYFSSERLAVATREALPQTRALNVWYKGTIDSDWTEGKHWIYNKKNMEFQQERENPASAAPPALCIVWYLLTSTCCLSPAPSDSEKVLSGVQVNTPTMKSVFCASRVYLVLLFCGCLNMFVVSQSPSALSWLAQFCMPA